MTFYDLSYLFCCVSSKRLHSFLLSLLKDYITYRLLMDKQIKIRSIIFSEGNKLFLSSYTLQNAPTSMSLHLSLTETIIQTNKK